MKLSINRQPRPLPPPTHEEGPKGKKTHPFDHFFLPEDYIKGRAYEAVADAVKRPLRYSSAFAAASEIMRETGLRYIVDIGCAYADEKSDLFAKECYIGIGSGARLNAVSQKVPGAKLICRDLSRKVALSEDILSQAIVVCENILGEQADPSALLQTLSEMNKSAPFVLISTIDRHRANGAYHSGPPSLPGMVHEWTCSEFSQLLKKHEIDNRLIGNAIYHGAHTEKLSILVIAGVHASFKKVPPKKVLTMVSCFNDEDIIEQVLLHLLREGMYLWVLDNWSEDKTWAICESLRKKYPDRFVGLERYPKEKPDQEYDWSGILGRKEEISFQQKDHYDWFIHHDSDEIRTSPWPGVSLVDAISFIGSVGYSAINHIMVDFRPTEDGFQSGINPKTFFSHFEFNTAPSAWLQSKGWASQPERIDLLAYGGHEASFKGRRVFPLRFLLAHYSLRSTQQALTKIFKYRLPRFGKTERDLGWHMHYDHYQKDAAVNFLWKTDELISYSPAWFESDYLMERLLGMNLKSPVMKRTFDKVTSMKADAGQS